MRILFFQRYLDPSEGGVERVSWILSSYFRSMGNECFHAFLEPDNFTGVSIDRKFQYSLSDDRKELERWIEYIRIHCIDIVIIQDIVCRNLITLRSELKKNGLNTKVVGVLHLNPEFEQYKKYPFKTRLKQHVIWTMCGYYKPQKDRAFLARSVDKYVVLSPSYIRTTKLMFGIVKPDTVVAIGNPLSFSVPEYCDWESKKNQFLMVARMDDTQKDFKSALRIWKLFESKCSDFKLIIAGAGRDESLVRNFAQELGLKNVKFMGHVDDPSSLYKESKFYLMTSRYEGWGMVLTEAMEYGMIPFVKNTYGAASDIVTNFKNGFLIESGNETAFADSMLETVKNVDIQKSMSKEAYQSCERFSSTSIGNKWLTLFDELMSCK